MTEQTSTDIHQTVIEPHRPSSPPRYTRGEGARYHMYGAVPGIYYPEDDETTSEDQPFPYIVLFFCLGFIFPFFWLISAFWINSADPNERLWARVSFIGFMTYMLLGSVMLGATMLGKL